jgi:biotin carboxyl carrier protein
MTFMRGPRRTTFEIEVGDRTRRVTVERTAAGAYRVEVDGTRHDVDAARVGKYGLSLLLGGDRTSQEIQVVPSGGVGGVLVWIEGKTVTAGVNARRTGRAGIETAAHGEQTIIAPMPGRVLRVLVAPGDEVAVRQPLVVVEAMKMENELRSPKAGRVKAVSVTPGTPVDAGRVLVVIE